MFIEKTKEKIFSLFQKKMDLLLNSPPDENSPGLAANDPTMLFPIAGAFLAVSFYINQQDNLLGPYLENSSDPKHELIGSIPMRFPDPDDGLVLFRGITKTQREWREKAIVKMVRDIDDRGDLFLGYNNVISSESVPEAMKAREERLERLGLKKSEKKKQSVSSRDAPVWIKKYIYESMFVKEIPSTRYLPLSFLIAIIDKNGDSKLYHGGVEKLTVESDADLLKVQDAENLALRVYGTCFDTNWRNMGTGTPKRIHFIYAQDNTGKADIAILDKAKESGGVKKAGITVTSFAINLLDKPVQFSSKWDEFYEEGLSLEVNRKYPHSLRLVHDQGAQLLFLARAMNRVFPSGVEYERGDKQVKIKGEIPLAMRFGDRVSRVNEIRLTSDNQFPDSDLDWSSVKLKGCMFSTESFGIIYQDTSGVDWKIKLPDGGTLGSKDITMSTRVELLVYSSQPAANPRLPDNIPTSFKNFQTPRYAQDVTFSLQKYNDYHALQPRLRTNSPEIKETTPYFESSIGWPPYLLAALFIAWFIFSWMKPNQNRAWVLGQAAGVAGVAFALLSVASFFAIQTDYIPWLKKTHDEVLFFAVGFLLLIGSVSIVTSLRFQRSVPSGAYMMSILLVLGMFLIRATPISKPEDLTENMVAWRSVLIIMIFKAGLLFSWECLKLGGKASHSKEILPLTTGLQYTNPGYALIVAMVFLIYPLYSLLLKADRPECDAYEAKKEWLQKEARNTNERRLKNEYEKEAEEIDQDFFKCSDFKNRVGSFSGKAMGLVGVGALFLYYLGTPIFSNIVKKIAPAKPITYHNAEMQDSRVLMVYMVAKTLISLGLLIFAFSILGPEFSFQSEPGDVCVVSQTNLDYFSENYGLDIDKVFFKTESKLAQIRDKFDALGCISEQNVAILGLLIFLVGIWSVSIITPPRFASSIKVPSILDAIVYIVFFVLSLFLLTWMIEKDNLRKALDISTIKSLNDFISLLRPPV